MDSPGTNDNDETRTDEKIQNEMFNSIRPTLSSETEGIGVVVQCVMPNEGGRIKRSTYDSM